MIESSGSLRLIGAWLLIGASPAIASPPGQVPDGATAVGGMGTIMPNGIRSYGTSMYFPTNSGGIPVTIPSGPSMPYRGFPGQPIPGNSGVGIQGYGYGFGYAAGEGGGPAAVGGIGLPSNPGGMYNESARANAMGNALRTGRIGRSYAGGGVGTAPAPRPSNSYVPMPTPPTGNLPMFTPLRYQWPDQASNR